MSIAHLDPRLAAELRGALDQALTAGTLMAPSRLDQHLQTFRERFGPNVLRRLDGEELLLLMHGRQDSAARCLVYWLEFKDDDEFAGATFGSVAGGSALKFGLYQRQKDGAWIAGSPNAPQVLSSEEAVIKARRQRDELLAGDQILAAMNAGDISDAVYARLQTEMEHAAPELHRDGWAHKYWFLLHPDRLDDYHSPRYQRFHLFKLLQMPPDGIGVLDGQATRFTCAGRFIAAAQGLDVPVTTLAATLNRREGFHRYWRVGTTEGSSGESQWDAMREGSFASVGWPAQVPDLTALLAQDKAIAKQTVQGWLMPLYGTNAAVASRKAGEILKFAQEAAENDLVLACEGQTVLGVGRIRGPYEYHADLAFPHTRRVEWHLVEPWKAPESEGLRTSVWELGKSAPNLLELEQRLFRREHEPPPSKPRGIPSKPIPSLPLPDLFTARVEGILRRKGQAVLYGPPGTGKTYHALRTARELAARHAFHRSFDALGPTEKAEIEGADGLVRLCTFHPGFGYEDFVEGLKPKSEDGRLVFEPQDGLFKQLCAAAGSRPNHNFFLVIDEFNRGDVPRIFGELLTVLEQDKRNILVLLPVTRKSFVVPPNVFLIGTMNTADRSISLLDAALRRRFGFIELMPDSSVLAGRKAGTLPLGPWLDALNARLRQHLKRDARNLQVGHAYLLPRQPIMSVAEFARVLRDDIIPLLEEYCYEDFGMLRDILGPALVDVENSRIQDELFEANQEDKLIQALYFAEMEESTLAEEAADAVDAAIDEDEGASPA